MAEKKEDRDILQDFKREMQKIPLLEDDEAKALLKKIEEGDEDARKKFVVSNLKLVAGISKEFRWSGLPKIDLIQEGYFGLEKAVERFDLGRKIKFSTYAVYWIRASMRRAAIEQGKMIRLPSNEVVNIGKLIKVESIAEKTGRKLTEEEKAAKLGMKIKKLKKVSQAKEIKRIRKAKISSSEEYSEDEIRPLIEILPDEKAPSPFETILQAELIWHSKEAEKTLSEVERRVLWARLKYERKLDEIGRDEEILKPLGKKKLSRERIRQIEKEAIGKLRREFEIKKIKETV